MISESVNTALSVKNVKMSQQSNFVVVGVCARATGTEGAPHPQPPQPPNGISTTHTNAGLCFSREKKEKVCLQHCASHSNLLCR